MKKEETQVTIEFANKVAANYFRAWLNDQGELDYRSYMEYIEDNCNDDDAITAIEFDYNDNPIKTKCGRLAKKHEIIDLGYSLLNRNGMINLGILNHTIWLQDIPKHIKIYLTEADDQFNLKNVNVDAKEWEEYQQTLK